MIGALQSRRSQDNMLAAFDGSVKDSISPVKQSQAYTNAYVSIGVMTCLLFRAIDVHRRMRIQSRLSKLKFKLTSQSADRLLVGPIYGPDPMRECK